MEHKEEFLHIGTPGLSAKGKCMDCGDMVEGDINVRMIVGGPPHKREVGLEVAVGEPGDHADCHPIIRVQLAKLPGVRMETVFTSQLGEGN